MKVSRQHLAQQFAAKIFSHFTHKVQDIGLKVGLLDRDQYHWLGNHCCEEVLCWETVECKQLRAKLSWNHLYKQYRLSQLCYDIDIENQRLHLKSTLFSAVAIIQKHCPALASQNVRFIRKQSLFKSVFLLYQKDSKEFSVRDII